MINIRLGNHHKVKENTMILLDEIKKHPGCCDAVWFASEYGYPLMDEHKSAAKNMIELAKLYREKGIRVDLQISNTIGHGEYMKSQDCSAIDTYNFEKIVGPDGTVSNYAFCWNGKNFRKYCYDFTVEYAKIKPHNVWIDDDLRATHHTPVEHACFCDECMSRFNKKHGSSFAREELAVEVSKGDIIWRKRFIDFVLQSMADFTGVLANAVISVSPDSHIGWQYTFNNHYAGDDPSVIFDKMRESNGKAPVSRPGGGAYDDKNPFILLDKQILMSYATATLPDYIEYNVPEIENTPDVTFGKTIYGTLLESSLGLAYGFTGLSYATLMTVYEDISFHGRMLEGFSKHRKYWQEMIDNNKNTVMCGLGIAKSGVNGTIQTDPFAYKVIPSLTGTAITRIGIAENHDVKNAQVLSLTSATIDTLTNSEIIELFDRPVITDAIAVEKIIERGLGKYLGISVSKIDCVSLKETFNGKTWSVSPFGVKPLPPYVISGNVKPISTLHNGITDECFGIANGIVPTQKSKWAVFGYGLWRDIVSSDKRNQIIDAIDEISDRKFPAILKTCEQVTIIPRMTKSGKTASVSVLNISIADTEKLELLVRNPVGEKFIYKNAFFEIELKGKKTADGYLLELPGFTRGWDMATLFIH